MTSEERCSFFDEEARVCASIARTRMLVPLTAIVTTSLPMVAAIAFCAKNRKTVHAKNKNKNKSSKSAKSSKSTRGASKSGKSRRSSKAKHSKRSSKSSKKGTSGKSGKGSSKRGGKSSKSSKSKKVKTATTSGSQVSTVSAATGVSDKQSNSSKSSRKSSKSSKSRKNRRLDSDAQKKMEKSGKSGKVALIPKTQQTTGSQVGHSLAEEVNSIKHSKEMNVAPAKLQYQTLGGVNQIELKNTSNERKAYKIKCSDNSLYRVNPVYGFAEPRSSVKIDVLRLNGEQKTDKLVLLTANANGSTNPHEAFANQAEHREMMVVPLVAA